MLKNVGLKTMERGNKELKSKLKNKPIDKDGYPIKRWEICFVCGEKFCLAFSFSQQNYSRRNFWFYWSENEDDKGKFIDNYCLKNCYLDSEKRKNLNLRKRRYLASYIHRDMLLN